MEDRCTTSASTVDTTPCSTPSLPSVSPTPIPTVLTLNSLSKNHVMKELHPIFDSPDMVGDVDVGNLLVDWVLCDGDNDSKCAGSACDDNDDDAHGSDIFTPALPCTLPPPLPPTLRLLHAPRASTQPVAGAVGPLTCRVLVVIGSNPGRHLKGNRAGNKKTSSCPE